MKITLPSLPEFFEATRRGDKTHEIRSRAEIPATFKPGDRIVLRETAAVSDTEQIAKPTGRTLTVECTYISPADEGHGKLPDFVYFSIRKVGYVRRIVDAVTPKQPVEVTGASKRAR